MAVFEHAFRRYEGPWSSERSRLLVVARYALTEAFQRRLHVVLLLLAQVPVLIGLVNVALWMGRKYWGMTDAPVPAAIEAGCEEVGCDPVDGHSSRREAT